MWFQVPRGQNGGFWNLAEISGTAQFFAHNVYESTHCTQFQAFRSKIWRAVPWYELWRAGTWNFTFLAAGTEGTTFCLFFEQFLR